ncbi:hypothetical protein LZ32DRAFT_446361 [Colletotrichum eremochloae]|nr:hypothetical protein LZ32DRAFT_446361 [Colletotrichum eremochloae]
MVHMRTSNSTPLHPSHLISSVSQRSLSCHDARIGSSPDEGCGMHGSRPLAVQCLRTRFSTWNALRVESCRIGGRECASFSRIDAYLFRAVNHTDHPVLDHKGNEIDEDQPASQNATINHRRLSSQQTSRTRSKKSRVELPRPRSVATMSL